MLFDFFKQPANIFLQGFHGLNKIKISIYVTILPEMQGKKLGFSLLRV